MLLEDFQRLLQAQGVLLAAFGPRTVRAVTHLDVSAVQCDEAAARLARAVGEAGVVARLGGDEFAVVLPGTTPQQAHELVARVRARTGVGFSIGGGVAISVALSQNTINNTVTAQMAGAIGTIMVVPS